MKQSIILWIGAFVIAFLFGFANRIASPEFPVTGSAAIARENAGFKFDRIYRGNDSYRVIVGTDSDSLTGEILWRKKDTASAWNKSPMHFTGKSLTGEIQHQPPRTLIEYKVKISKDNISQYIPKSGNVDLKFLAAVPDSIMGFYFFTLFLALIFSARTGLEYFNQNEKIKKLSLFTIMIWISNVMVFNPVKRSYELSSKIGTQVIPISSLFDIPHVLLFLLWILGIILIFNLKNYKIAASAIAAATFVIFLFVK
jgi:hypothetical protein